MIFYNGIHQAGFAVNKSGVFKIIFNASIDEVPISKCYPGMLYTVLFDYTADEKNFAVRLNVTN